MTAEDRISAVAEFGFTRRQARFLTLVMRHAGVCLLRQYSTFAGIVYGQKRRMFFQKLVSRGYASRTRADTISGASITCTTSRCTELLTNRTTRIADRSPQRASRSV
jgi:hypothetical protein